jgi:uncharacterized protein YvpB
MEGWWVMAEEIERRLDLTRKDKTQTTEILNISGDSIVEVKTTFKSGNIIVMRC